MTRTAARGFLLTTTFAALAFAAVVAVAQPAARPGPGMMGGGGPGMMGGGGPGMMGGYWNTGTYLDALKTQLAITPNQEPAWKEYADTVSGVGEQMQGLHQTMFESMGTASWQERRNQMNQMFEARQQAFATVHAAATKLMSTLDPAQKAKAQSILPGLAFRRGMMNQP
ncbi:MAG TPA: Spy/CpxP family protein refolding chaperone [Acetobacteraceae bacterium]|nr:Spy/CpxP family protein refolding chaperone [Acetobacteraceae bacterium]